MGRFLLIGLWDSIEWAKEERNHEKHEEENSRWQPVPCLLS
jgi:hypothetical protein